MKRWLLLVLLIAAPLHAQTPVVITNTQAVDYVHDAALSLGTTSGPLLMCRTSAAEPTNASGDTRAFAVWCHGSGALHTIATDLNGNDLTALTAYHYFSAASNNSTSVKGSGGSVHMVHVQNTTGTQYYVRLYNSATAPTCSSATNYVKTIVAYPNAPNGYSLSGIGETFSNGIGFCITSGFANNDNGNAATGVSLSIDYR